MIYKNNKEIIQILKGNKIISAVYKGKQLVWQAVRSCFGSGKWMNDKSWVNNEGWKN